MRLFLFTLLSLASSSLSASPCTGNMPSCVVGNVVDLYKMRGVLSGTLLVRKGRKEFEWDIGLADDKKQTPNSRNTIFLIASVSKSFVAASILKVAEQGKLHFDDKLTSYIAEYPRADLTGANGIEVTLNHLLTHTSGVPDAYQVPAIEAQMDKVPLSFDNMIGAVKDQPLKFPPGSKFEYSNTGYLILGEVAHRASQTGYADFLKKNFLGPLGMNDTTVGPPADTSAVARSYLLEAKRRIDVRDKYGLGNLAASSVYADTDIYTNLGDLAKWADEITSGAALSPASTKIMLTPHLNEYGYGWFIYNDGQGRLAYEHSGDYGGFQSWVRRYPNDRLTVIWLSNQAMEQNQLSSFIEQVAGAAFRSAW